MRNIFECKIALVLGNNFFKTTSDTYRVIVLFQQLDDGRHDGSGHGRVGNKSTLTFDLN